MSRFHLCVYCGANEATTADHVPPRGLFPKPRPSNLITVPCCETCRSGQSLDDEYFIRTVAMRHDVADNTAASAVLETVQRALRKPRKEGFKRALLASVKEVPVFSRGGIYLGNGMSYTVEVQRLARVAERITLGLYYREFGERLPDSHQCVAFPGAAIDLSDVEAAARLQRIVRFAVSGRKNVIGDNVFAYGVNQIARWETVWVHLVYGKAAFIALTLSHEA